MWECTVDLVQYLANDVHIAWPDTRVLEVWIAVFAKS
jgi:hypothetical protein